MMGKMNSYRNTRFLGAPSTWVTLMIILVWLATLAYFHGLRGNLPYHLDPDEPVYFLSAIDIKHTGLPQLKPTYPPLRFYEMAAEQILADMLAGGQSDSTVYFIYSRAVSAYAALLLLTLLYRVGSELCGSLAGFIGAILLAFDIQMVTFSHLARGDTLAWLLSFVTILGSLRLLQQSTKRIWLFTLVAAVGAFLAKYSVAPILLLPGYMILTAVVRRSSWRIAIISLALASLLGTFWYVRMNTHVWLLPFQNAGIEFLLSSNFNFLKNFLASWGNLRAGAGDYWLAIGLTAFPLSMLWLRSSHSREKFVLLALLGVVVAVTLALFPTTTFRYWDGYLIVLILPIFSGIALALSAEKLGRVGTIVALGLVVWVSWPKLLDAWNFGEQQTRPHTLATLGDWFIQNVPEGARTIAEGVHPFNSYVGFPAKQIYHAFVADSIFDEGVEAYRERGYEYLIWTSIKSSRADQLSDLELPEKQTYLAMTKEVLRLGSDPYQGPNIVVFKIPPIQQHPLYLWFTPAISFRGYDLNKGSFKPGDDLELMFYWMSAERVKANYIVFVHVMSAETGELLVGKDEPTDNGFHPTFTWGGDMQFIRDRHTLTIPANAKAGSYIVRFGMYDADTKARVKISTPKNETVGDLVVLQEIQVEK
jgi:hypothetical protein